MAILIIDKIEFKSTEQDNSLKALNKIKRNIIQWYKV